MSPRFIEKVLDSLRPGWRSRQAKRKSGWNIACVVLAGGLALLCWYALFQSAWRLHEYIYPTHAGLQHEFWRSGISTKAFISSFLMLIPLGLPALIAGAVLANCLIALIPGARHTMNAEAADDAEMTLQGSNAGLIRWFGLPSVICVILSVLGLATLSSLQ